MPLHKPVITSGICALRVCIRFEHLADKHIHATTRTVAKSNFFYEELRMERDRDRNRDRENEKRETVHSTRDCINNWMISKRWHGIETEAKERWVQKYHNRSENVASLDENGELYACDIQNQKRNARWEKTHNEHDEQNTAEMINAESKGKMLTDGWINMHARNESKDAAMNMSSSSTTTITSTSNNNTDDNNSKPVRKKRTENYADDKFEADFIMIQRGLSGSKFIFHK